MLITGERELQTRRAFVWMVHFGWHGRLVGVAMPCYIVLSIINSLYCCMSSVDPLGGRVRRGGERPE